MGLGNVLERDCGVMLRGLQPSMAQELFHVLEIGAAGQEMRRADVAV